MNVKIVRGENAEVIADLDEATEVVAGSYSHLSAEHYHVEVKAPTAKFSGYNMEHGDCMTITGEAGPTVIRIEPATLKALAEKFGDDTRPIYITKSELSGIIEVSHSEHFESDGHMFDAEGNSIEVC